jgi:hypothetical protein
MSEDLIEHFVPMVDEATLEWLRSDGHSLPVAVLVARASPHETKLVEPTSSCASSAKLRSDRAYNSDPLDARMRERFGVELVVPHTSMRIRKETQDCRELRRYRSRWKIDRLFA